MKFLRPILSLTCKALGLALVLVAIPATAFGVPPVVAPEISPASAAAAISVLAGGMLMLTDRILRKKAL